MRKLLTVIAVLGLVLTVGSTIARAQSPITLGASAASLTFTGGGSGSPSTISLTLGTPCTTSKSICSANQSGTPSGFYDITGSPTITLTNTLNLPTVNQWTVAQSSALTFEFCSNAGCTGLSNTVYLSGTLELVNLTQTGTGGQFNYNSVANLTITGGTEAASWASGSAVATLYLDFGLTPVNLGSLLGTTNSVAGVKFGTGTIDPTPEPSSMLLFGSGLLAAGFILRRRLMT